MADQIGGAFCGVVMIALLWLAFRSTSIERKPRPANPDPAVSHFSGWEKGIKAKREADALAESVRPPEIQHMSPAEYIRSAELRVRSSYFQSDEWYELKAEALERESHICQLCGKHHLIHVVHLAFERRGNEQSGDVAVLCDACHHEYQKTGTLPSRST